jgi:hypothetical protein
MKRILQLTLGSFFLFIAFSAKTQVPDWQVAGTRGITPDAAYSQSLAFDQSSQKVLLAQTVNTDIKAYRPVSVLKFTGAGLTGWEPVGDQFCFGGWVHSVTMDCSVSGQPFIATISDSKSGGELSVLNYSLSGGWSMVGGSAIAQFAGAPVIKVLREGGVDVPYVAFIYREDMKSGKLEVMKYNQASGWTDLDPANRFPNQTVFGGNCPGLAINSQGIVYAASIERPDKNPFIQIRKFTGSWQAVLLNEPWSMNARELSLAIDPADDQPAVAFSDENGAVFAYKFNGSVWQPMNNGQAAGSGYGISLAFSKSSGAPVLAFIESTKPERIAVKQYTGGSWSYLVNPFNNGMSYNVGPSLGFTMDSWGSPYVAFADQPYFGKSSVLYCPMTPPEKQLSSYVILGSSEAQVGESNQINSGWVGLTEKGRMAQFKAKSRLYPGFVKADAVNIHPTAYVPNIMEGAAEVNLPGMQYSAGSGENGTLIIPANTNQTVSQNNVNLKIGSNSSVTVTGNIYGKIDVGAGSQVFFTSPGLDIEEMVTAKATAAAPTVLSFAGSTDVRVKSNVDIGDYCQVRPLKSSSKIAYYIGEELRGNPGQMTIRSEGVVFEAGAFIPRGQILVIGGNSGSRACQMTGQFIAAKINSEGKNVSWNLKQTFSEGSNPKAPLSPSDGVNAVAVDNLRVYPVPTRGTFRFSGCDNFNGIASVRIYNLLGEMVLFRDDIQPGILSGITFDLVNQPAGIYTAIITAGGEKTIRKIIIAK